MVLAAMLLTGQAFETMENVLAAAKRNMVAITSGNDRGKPIITSKQLVAITGNIKNTIADMDANVQLMMAIFLKKTSNAKTYSDALKSMKQNPVMGGNADLFIKREDEFIPSVDSFWKFKGNPSTHTVKTVNTWFEKLIGDEQVLAEMNLTEGDIGYLVKSISTILKTLKTDCLQNDLSIIERGVISLPVVRFPTKLENNIVIYNIDVNAWIQCKTGNMITDAIDSLKSNPNFGGGLTGSFLTATFAPRDSVINNLKPEIKEKAIRSVVAELSA